MRRLTPLLLLAVAACADTTVAPEAPSLARIKEAEGSHGGAPFMAVLLPQNEVGPMPAGDPTGPVGDPNPMASGIVYLTLNSGQEEICYKMTYRGLSTNAMAAHIHDAPAGSNSRVVVPLSVGAPGTSGSVAECVYASRELIKAIRKNPENYYVNVHTQLITVPESVEQPGRPRGAIRGQLTKTQGSNVNHG